MSVSKRDTGTSQVIRRGDDSPTQGIVSRRNGGGHLRALERNEMQHSATDLEPQQIEPVQAEAIRYLLEGGRLSAVASTVGVSRVTLWRWSKTPEWQDAMTQERQLLETAIRAQLQALALESVYVVDAALRSQDKALALKAALAVLRGTGALPGHAEPGS